MCVLGLRMTHFEINSSIFPEIRYRKQESLLFFKVCPVACFLRTESWNRGVRQEKRRRLILARGGWWIEGTQKLCPVIPGSQLTLGSGMAMTGLLLACAAVRGSQCSPLVASCAGSVAQTPSPVFHINTDRVEGGKWRPAGSQLVSL